MLEEIQKGVKLKKVVTVEKTGLDYIKKKGDTMSKKDSKGEVKGDLFSEMRKIQLKKVNK